MQQKGQATTVPCNSSGINAELLLAAAESQIKHITAAAGHNWVESGFRSTGHEKLFAMHFSCIISRRRGLITWNLNSADSKASLAQQGLLSAPTELAASFHSDKPFPAPCTNPSLSQL